ncbi:MAG: D-glycerate dehydrogenase [Candidatus Obscuribacterales bacterium]|nr:D-glycerate dehydrogenase [Candidatus Obscuribacterales bacterium]
MTGPSLLISAAIPGWEPGMVPRGFDCTITEQGVMEGSEFLANAFDKDVIACFLANKITDEFMQSHPRLKMVANIAVGFDNVDVSAATRRGILVSNTPGVLDAATADLAFALLLSAARRIPQARQYFLEGKWKSFSLDFFTGSDVFGKTLGIVGLGRIGQAMAARAGGFSMPILYTQRRPASPEVEQRLRARYVSLDQLLAQSDFVSLHCPLTEETKGLIDAACFEKMKTSAYLINTARGAIVNQCDLVAALRANRIGGAALDVFEKEPCVPPADLAMLSNVVLVPHIGSATIDTRKAMARLALSAVSSAFAGVQPPNLVNPEVWPVFRDRLSAAEC